MNKQQFTTASMGQVELEGMTNYHNGQQQSGQMDQRGDTCVI